ncbi:hypothetical protein [Actinokineospora spheciospongiae]|uniref:hypothetical protein n=1 Tax=Actinokineospora spheciospongiae TaxID=909613 RepID=UPI000D8B91D0|nr:hypothetical protein [Actinokineospora spheciospongiae]PWW62172.1 hypothetical protein DFQ13_106429 [Actinokineospora spheciospongiae]
MTTEDTTAENGAGESTGRHAAKEGAERHPLIDLDRDPNPGRADHAAEDDPE